MLCKAHASMNKRVWYPEDCQWSTKPLHNITIKVQFVKSRSSKRNGVKAQKFV